MLTTLIITVFSGTAILLWQYLEKVKIRAFNAARKHCEQLGLQFLDESVVLKKLTFKRLDGGILLPVACYQFEFTSTGEHRYLGWVYCAARKIISIELQPHTLH